jgi:hypothetical protein
MQRQMIILSQENERLQETIRLLRQELLVVQQQQQQHLQLASTAAAVAAFNVAPPRSGGTSGRGIAAHGGTTSKTPTLSTTTTPHGHFVSQHDEILGLVDVAGSNQPLHLHHPYAVAASAGLKHRKSPSRVGSLSQQHTQPKLTNTTTSTPPKGAITTTTSPSFRRTMSVGNDSSPSLSLSFSCREGVGGERKRLDLVDDDDADESTYIIDLEGRPLLIKPPPGTPRRVMTPETLANTTVFGDEDDDDDDNNDHHHRHAVPPQSSFFHAVQDRGAWLIGLLLLQSLSSFIIRRNEVLLQQHIIIVQFLTMLVGAGGNGGNQGTIPRGYDNNKPRIIS